MIVILGLIILAMILSMKICKSGIDGKYLSKEYTQPIKGFFVIIVFLSHVRTYAEYASKTDLLTISFLDALGQLMVALFLFYSGYGIYEAIKSKGNSYIDSLLKNRFGKTFFDFGLAICLFLIVDTCLGIYYPLDRVALAFIGWTSVGNSSWYMFAVFTLYIMSFGCFYVFKNLKYGRFISICLMSICSLGYVYIMSIVKEGYWCDTYLCFAAGMWYSYLKKYIDEMLKRHSNLYYMLTGLVILMFGVAYGVRHSRVIVFNVVAVLFCFVVVFLSMKFSFQSKVLTWIGNHLFWVYILQRIPMLVLHQIGFADKHPYMFLYACFIITLIFAYYMNIGAKKIKDKIWK